MEFLGYAYDVKELIEILRSAPEHYTIAIHSADCSYSTPEVWYDESRREIIFK